MYLEESITRETLYLVQVGRARTFVVKTYEEEFRPEYHTGRMQTNLRQH